MYRTLITVIAVLAFTLLSTTNAYNDCGSKVGSVENVVISDCNNNDARCILKRNSTVKISITFKSGAESKVLKSVVHGVILGVPAPFNLPNPDGCVDSGVACPVKKDQTYEYHTLLPVLSEYPRLTLDVKWELQDENGEDFICILIPSKIK